MKKIVVGVALLLCAIVVAGYLNISERRHIITIPETDIQAALQSRLPLTQTYYGSLRLTLDNPRVSLDADKNRINTVLDLALNVRESDIDPDRAGTVAVSGSVRYQGSTGEFYMLDPYVENISVPDLGEDNAVRLKSALAMMLPVFYSQNPIYTLDAGAISEPADGLLLGDVVVRDKALIVSLGRK